MKNIVFAGFFYLIHKLIGHFDSYLKVIKVDICKGKGTTVSFCQVEKRLTGLEKTSDIQGAGQMVLP